MYQYNNDLAIMRKLVLIFAVMTLSLAAWGEFDMNATVPMDTDVRYGKLPNGLTYYIKHNEKPKNRCEFRIAQDVGAILEEDDQNGLAHFLEHMCFNGTEHFPDKGIINYFESIGVSFGNGINAYTDVDETVYRLSDVPTTRDGILDTALLVLYDWSCGVLLHDEEIEKERGVILEEWRTGNTASERMSVKRIQMKMPGSQYAKRDVIGDTAVINNFKPQTLRDFYRKWYGPDLQAIIVVGDVDVDKMEQKVISLFSPIKPREGLTPRTRYDALDNEKPITGVYLDPEAHFQNISIGFKHPCRTKETNSSYEAHLERAKRSLIMDCLSNRMKDIYGMDIMFNFFPLMSCSYQNLAGETDVFSITMRPDNGKERSSYLDMCKELERIRRYGITEEELELVKKTKLAGLEHWVATYKNSESAYFVTDCKIHFMDNISITNADFELYFYKNFTSKVTLNELNEMIRGFFNEDDRNMYIVATGRAKPDGNGKGCAECDMPTEEELLATYLAVKDSAIEPPVFKKNDKKLVEKEPKPGEIISRRHNDELDVTEIVLSNNVKVMVKKTDFNANEIRIDARSKGGYSLYSSEKDILNARFAGSIVSRNGVGNMTPLEQEKLLAGKHASISGASISENYESIEGYSSTTDFETLLQLFYLHFTAPRIDDKLFNEYIGKRKSYYASTMSSPTYDFYKGLADLKYGHSDRYVTIDTNTIKLVDQKRAIEIFKERFANPADFTFFVVGDIDIEDSATTGYIEKWIGGMQTSKEYDNFAKAVDIIDGTHYYYRKHSMMTGTATNTLTLTGYGFDMSIVNLLKARLLGSILGTRYLESIREKEGGTYGVGVDCYLFKHSVPHIELNISFDTDPDKQNRLLNITYDEIEKIIAEGPIESDLDKEKEILRNEYEENLLDNYSWMNFMNDYYNNDMNFIRDYVNVLNSITGEDIRQMLKSIYEQRNCIEAVLMPARW